MVLESVRWLNLLDIQNILEWFPGIVGVPLLFTLYVLELVVKMAIDSVWSVEQLLTIDWKTNSGPLQLRENKCSTKNYMIDTLP